MIKEVMVSKCKCESCSRIVSEYDVFCKYCGYKLDDKVTYEELPKVRDKDYSC